MKTYWLALGLATLSLSASALVGCSSTEDDDDGDASALLGAYSSAVEICLAPVKAASGGSPSSLARAHKGATRCLARANDGFARRLAEASAARPIGSLRDLRGDGERLCELTKDAAREACRFQVEHMATLAFRVHAEGADLPIGGAHGAEECTLEVEVERWGSRSEADQEIERAQSSADCFLYRTNRIAGETREAGRISARTEDAIVSVNVEIQDAIFGLCESIATSRALESRDEERLVTYSCSEDLASAFHDIVVTTLEP